MQAAPEPDFRSLFEAPPGLDSVFTAELLRDISVGQKVQS